jgi:hypothetical protein
MVELTNEERKDVRLLVLEIQNVGLQIQALQAKFNSLQSDATVFEDTILKVKGVSRETHSLDFNTATIMAKPI